MKDAESPVVNWVAYVTLRGGGTHRMEVQAGSRKDALRQVFSKTPHAITSSCQLEMKPAKVAA